MTGGRPPKQKGSRCERELVRLLQVAGFAAARMLPHDWPFPHAGLMAILANQEEWDRDFPKLMAVPAAWRGVSVEPMLGPVDIGNARPNWIICGGESGPRHRFIDPDWVRSLRDQCARYSIAFHFKQWGGLRPKQNGCLLDGCEHKDFPLALQQGASR
jgi:protein gp37